MADLISREAAIDAIVSVTVFPDADYIKNLCENPSNSEDWLGGVCDAINAVEDVNAVDAVPVVRCRECRNWETDWKPNNSIDGEHFCPMISSVISGEWFCAYGERRDDDGKGA